MQVVPSEEPPGPSPCDLVVKFFNPDLGSVHDILPGLTGNELQNKFDDIYLTHDDVHVKLCDEANNEFLVDRHPWNDRGDRSVINHQKDSISTCGLMAGITHGGVAYSDW